MTTDHGDTYLTTEELAETLRVQKCAIEKRRYRGSLLPPEHHFPGMKRTLYKRSEAEDKETWVPARPASKTKQAPNGN